MTLEKLVERVFSEWGILGLLVLVLGWLVGKYVIKARIDEVKDLRKEIKGKDEDHKKETEKKQKEIDKLRIDQLEDYKKVIEKQSQQMKEVKEALVANSETLDAVVERLEYEDEE